MLPKRLRQGVAMVLLAALLLFPVSALPYADTDDSFAYAQEAIDQMFRLGIMQGSPLGDARVFRPADFLERQEFFKVVYALSHAGQADAGSFYERLLSQSTLKDLDDISPWARGYAGYCLANRFFVGNHRNRLMPRESLTVLEAMIVMLRLLGFSADSLARPASEPLDVWQKRLVSYAENARLLHGMSESGKMIWAPVTRADAAVLVSNALAAKLVTFIPAPEGGGTYVTGAKTLQDLAYGTLGEEISLAVAIAGDQYVLENGTTLQPLAPEKATLLHLGRHMRYFTAENNDTTAWEGAPAALGRLVFLPAGEMHFAFSEEGVTLSVNAETFVFSTEEGESARVFLFEGANSGRFVSIYGLSEALYPYMLYAPAAAARLTFDENDRLCAVSMLP